MLCVLLKVFFFKSTNRMGRTLQDNLQEFCNLTKISCNGVVQEEHLYCSVLSSLGSLRTDCLTDVLSVLLARGFWTFVKGISEGSLNVVNPTINIKKTTHFQARGSILAHYVYFSQSNTNIFLFEYHVSLKIPKILTLIGCLFFNFWHFNIPRVDFY